MRKVCLFTSARAEWSLLQGVAEKIRESPALYLQLLVSGSHLSPQLGMTVNEIEAGGFQIDERVDILKFDDNSVGICKVMGLAVGSYGEALERLSPDILVILGDRYESFCVAAAAQILRIPIAHIHGGETTEGAVDEAFRHSITKMAHLHFASCEDYRRRIIQLGENPSQVYNVGALGIENVRKFKCQTSSELESSIQFQLDAPFFLVTFHPVTLEDSTAGAQVEELFAALDNFSNHKIIITKANADNGGQEINQKIDAYAAAHPERCLAVTSLGHIRYLSAMKYCDAVVGNSSSGIIEAPVFNVPTVNIGDRQKGRMSLPSIINCTPEKKAIMGAIFQAINPIFRSSLVGLRHPCDAGKTSALILKALVSFELPKTLKKSFYDLGSSHLGKTDLDSCDD